MLDWSLLALGGAVGGALRVALAEAVTARTSLHFPWGILVVNLTGALAIGLLAGLVQESLTWQVFALGVLGSYTTVSSFSLQSLQLAQDGRGVQALAYVGASLCGCVLAAALGLMMAGAAA